MKWAQQQEELENYLEFESILMLYIIKHHREAYWRNLCISHSKKKSN